MTQDRPQEVSPEGQQRFVDLERDVAELRRAVSALQNDSQRHPDYALRIFQNKDDDATGTPASPGGKRKIKFQDVDIDTFDHTNSVLADRSVEQSHFVYNIPGTAPIPVAEGLLAFKYNDKWLYVPIDATALISARLSLDLGSSQPAVQGTVVEVLGGDAPDAIGDEITLVNSIEMFDGSADQYALCIHRAGAATLYGGGNYNEYEIINKPCADGSNSQAAAFNDDDGMGPNNFAITVADINIKVSNTRVNVAWKAGNRGYIYDGVPDAGGVET